MLKQGVCYPHVIMLKSYLKHEAIYSICDASIMPCCILTEEYERKCQRLRLKQEYTHPHIDTFPTPSHMHKCTHNIIFRLGSGSMKCNVSTWFDSVVLAFCLYFCVDINN